MGSGDTLHHELTIESEKYDDLIIGDFVDNYDNLPFKTFLGFQFFAEFCYPQKKIVIFHDSDAFVLVPDIITDYKTQWDLINDKRPWAPTQYLDDDAVYCIKGQSIPRKSTDTIFPFGIAKTYSGKWWNWYSDWDPRYKIPQYCNGNCNSLAGEAAYKIWIEAQRTNRHSMRIEDKFFLGILRKKAGIPNKSVVPVTQIARFDSHYNGYTRCVHISDAVFYHDIVYGPIKDGQRTVINGTRANTTELMYLLTDLYLSGKWLFPPKGLIYGRDLHLAKT